MRTEIAYLPGGSSEAQSNLGYAASCFDSKASPRKSNRKKCRKNSKAAKKSSQKVFAEELLSNVGNDELAPSIQCCRDSSENEAINSMFVLKCDCAPPVSPPNSCIHLEKFSQINIHTSTRIADSPSCEISHSNNSHSHCLISYPKPNASMNCGLQPLGCCNTELHFIQEDNCSAQANRGSCLNQNIQRARNNMDNVSRKDQSCWTWKRCEKSRKSANVPLPDHVHLDSSLQTVSSLIRQAPVAKDDFSFIPYSSLKQNCDVSSRKELVADGDILCRAVHVEVIRESFTRVFEQRLRSEFHHSGFHAQPMSSIYSEGSEELLSNQTHFGENKHNNFRGTRCQGSKLYRRQYEYVPSQTKQYFPCEEKFSLENRGTFDSIEQCEWMKRVKSREDKNSHHFLNENRRNVSSSNSNITSRDRRGQGLPLKPSPRKWIPVCNEKVKPPEDTISDMGYSSISGYSPMGKNDSILQGVIPLSVPDAPSDPQTTELFSTPEMASVVEQAPETESSNSMNKRQLVQRIKDYCQPFSMPEGFPHLFISAQVVEQAFISSYRLQMASESAQLATGYPLAKFEKLLSSASPLIASSVSPERCNGCFNNQLYSPSIREKTLKISLHSIWGWYEEPGNYGLKVNVKDSPNHQGCVAGTVDCHAFFVPLLSAVQLFGYHHSSSSCGNIKEGSLEVDDKEAIVKLHQFGNPDSQSGLEASVIDDTLADMIKSPATDHLSYTTDGTKPPTLAAPFLLSSAELIFEYFESEQPQKRMPLHKKIMELANGGTSDAQVFGDPSKLECSYLDDLHPASWFSVAWYPIYRIPEGKLQAAFLTYHSLGHFFQRPVATDNSDKIHLGLNLPVIGLESYNAQGELWFSHNKEVESSLGELTSTVLKERLKILEANALLFARGMVSKDDKMVANRQPDYEFFMSRIR